MIPNRFREKDGNYKFFYPVADIRKFILQGRSEGNNGWIIVSKIDNIITYRGYGTIEHPSKELKYIHVVHNPHWDGEFNVDRIMYPETTFDLSKLRVVMLGFSNTDTRNILHENEFRDFENKSDHYTEKYYNDEQ